MKNFDYPLLLLISVLFVFVSMFAILIFNTHANIAMNNKAEEACHPYKVITRHTDDYLGKKIIYVICTSNNGKAELKEIK